MNTVTTQPQFAAMTEEAVLQALDAYDALFDDLAPEVFEAAEANEEEITFPSDPNFPVAQEVERLVNAYADRFDAHVREVGEVPDQALLYRSDVPIEQVAFDIFTEALHDSLMDEDDE